LAQAIFFSVAAEEPAPPLEVSAPQDVAVTAATISEDGMLMEDLPDGSPILSQHTAAAAAANKLQSHVKEVKASQVPVADREVWRVEEITVGGSFVTIHRTEDPDPPASEISPTDSQIGIGNRGRPWKGVPFAVCAAILDHAASGRPAVDPSAPHPHQDTVVAEGDSEVVQALKEVIAETIRPQLQADGGDIRFVQFEPESGALRIEMLGACKTCRSSPTTLRILIERTVKHWIPEVKEVVEVKPSASKKQH
jgi:Fe-S cluster biogenesis protein NfuA